ncbi:ssDNA-binding protein [Sphingomonas hankookensis]|uniref:ssDNA-binding protein n=1 Tax=Sphingomonas hankookensis TaxID=563996 RepID=UPI003D303901
MAKAPITITQDPKNPKNITVKLTDVPLAFADDVFEAKQGSNDDGSPRPEFTTSVNVLLDKETDAGKAQIEGIKQAMRMARDAEWAPQNGKPGVSIAANCYCLQDGEPVDPGTGERAARWAGYEGKMYLAPKKYLKAKTQEAADREMREKPPVQILGPTKSAIDAQGKPCFPTLKKEDDLIYSGAVTDVILQIWPYNGVGKKPGGGNHPNRINASLECIKFVRHGERMGGGTRIDANSAFDEEDGDEVDVGGGSAAQEPADEMDALG